MSNQKVNNNATMDKESLEKKIEEIIISSNMTYGDVNSVLKKLSVVYMDKGNNLLNTTHIQKVIDTPRFDQ